MPRRRLKAWITALLVIGGLVPWLVRSDLTRLIVLERDILLGRYSFPWFCACAFLITPGCWLGAWAMWTSRTRPHRAILFRLVALGLALLLGLVAVDVGARLLRKPIYVRTAGETLSTFPLDQQAGTVLHRLPDQRYVIEYRDEPEAARSYPGRPRGHPTIPITLTTDGRGFRNQHARDRYDVIAVGDSFVEGCQVSDEHPWPVLLAAHGETTVYNLGTSGADPENYLNALRAVGMPLRPRTVVLMLCEYNDFLGVKRSAGGGSSLGFSLEVLLRSSPVYRGLKSALIAWFGPIGADGLVPGFDAIGAWMPARIPAGPAGHNYATKPKRILALDVSREAFAASYGWTSTAQVLRDVQALCAAGGARLVVTLAPSKARILMRLLEDRVTADQLHHFLSLRRRALPAAAVIRRRLLERLDSREDVLRDFCRAEGIPYVGLTAALTEAAAGGRQVYFTYDEHLTPEGHQVVADRVAEHLGLP